MDVKKVSNTMRKMDKGNEQTIFEEVPWLIKLEKIATSPGIREMQVKIMKHPFTLIYCRQMSLENSLATSGKAEVVYPVSLQIVGKIYVEY